MDFKQLAITKAIIGKDIKQLSEEKADKFTVGDGLQMDGDVLGVKGFKLLASYTFDEAMNGFEVTEIDGNPINLKGMAVICDRIGDGTSETIYSSPYFTVGLASGAATTYKCGYFAMTGAMGNCWYVRCEIDGEFMNAESAMMTPGSNSQITNGWMSAGLAKEMSWRGCSASNLPVTSINAVKFSVTGSNYPITPGTRLWIYGKEF